MCGGFYRMCRFLVAAFFIVLSAATVLHAEIQQPEERFTNALGQTFVYISPGTFMMGSPEDERGRSEDETQHSVTLTRGFYMQTTEVTQAQWLDVMENNPSHFQDCGPQCPVENVSWEDVQLFIQRLNQRETLHTYRLPTEAEWEYAARAGTTGPFAGSSLDSLGWYRNNSGDRTHPVARKSPNAWGLYDMHGNIREWVQDWYGSYPEGSVVDPRGPARGRFRINRGGAKNMIAAGCRAAYRSINSQSSRYSTLGFRLAADVRQ